MSKKEPWKTGQRKLQQAFDAALERIWEKWDEEGMEGTPFGNLQDIVQSGMDSTEIDNYYYEVGWLRGVSEAFGWSLNRPGPREWSPRDKR